MRRALVKSLFLVAHFSDIHGLYFWLIWNIANVSLHFWRYLDLSLDLILFDDDVRNVHLTRSYHFLGNNLVLVGDLFRKLLAAIVRASNRAS